MTYYVVQRDGKPLFGYREKAKCVAEMLVRDMIADIERFGCVWKQGIELIEHEGEPNGLPTRPLVSSNQGG